jgi:hypothetical protein
MVSLLRIIKILFVKIHTSIKGERKGNKMERKGGKKEGWGRENERAGLVLKRRYYCTVIYINVFRVGSVSSSKWDKMPTRSGLS